MMASNDAAETVSVHFTKFKLRCEGSYVYLHLNNSTSLAESMEVALPPKAELLKLRYWQGNTHGKVSIVMIMRLSMELNVSPYREHQSACVKHCRGKVCRKHDQQ